MHLLVHFENFQDMEAAIRRKKQLKKWPRARKLALIESHNAEWRDLYSVMSGLAPDTA